MSCIVRRIAARGSRVAEAASYEAGSLNEAARYEKPGGVYAAFGTWHNHSVIRLTDHLDRFEDSARRVGFTLSLDRSLVRAELCEIMREYGFAGARMRISAHPDDELLTVAMEPYTGPPPELRLRGVACRTAAHAARATPRAKQTGWLADRSRFSRTDEPYEWLLLDDDDRILEGGSSNFYAVVQESDRPDGGEMRSRGVVLHTAGEGVLFGIARSIVLEIAPEIVAVRLAAPSLTDVDKMSEAFLSSASRGIIPVVEIDEHTVGDGTPGSVTRALIKRYDARALELEEPLCD